MGECFVTVGTTRFDALIRALDDLESVEATLDAFERQGVTTLTFQIGRGQYEPDNIIKAAKRRGGFHASFFRFSPSIKAYIDRATFIISHAGAGSIVESLRAKKSLLVVVNTSLMDNHQAELANALGDDKYLHHTTPESVLACLKDLDFSSCKPFPAADHLAFPKLLDQQMGF